LLRTNFLCKILGIKRDAKIKLEQLRRIKKKKNFNHIHRPMPGAGKNYK
jgi:hypothetical protein